jgi:hypothetical protein
MATRIRKTPEQKANELERMARAARKKANQVGDAKRTRRAVIGGLAIQAMAAAGDRDCERAWNKMLAGLKRKQDRLAFDLEPLPEPRADDDQPVNPPVLAVPPVVPPVPAASPAPARPVHPQDRLDRAVAAWDAAKDSPAEVREPLRVEVGQAIAGVERVSGQLWADLPAKNRSYYGLGERPGELARAS